MKTLIAGLIVTGMGLGILYLFKTGKISFRSKPSAAVVETPRPSDAPIGDPRIRLGTTACDAQGCSLSLAIKVTKECFTGDFNLIKLDMTKASAKPSFLISLEPLLLGESSVIGSAQEVTLKEATEGVVKTFRLPRFQRPTQLGIFLCKDAKGEGKCAGKEYKDFNGLMGMLFKGLAGGAGFRSPDHIYFFQYLIWEEEGKIAAMYDENPQMMTDELYAIRLNYLMSRSPLFPKERQAAMDKIRGISQALRSLPLEIQGSQYTMVLPVRDPACKPKPSPIPSP